MPVIPSSRRRRRPRPREPRGDAGARRPARRPAPGGPRGPWRAPREDAVHPPRHGGADRGGVGHRVADVREQHRARLLRTYRAAGEGLEGHGREGVDVELAVAGSPSTCSGETYSAVPKPSRRGGQAGHVVEQDEAEVAQEGRAGGVEQDVAGLHVAVHRSLSVREVDGLGDVREDREGVRRSSAPPRAIRSARVSPGTSRIEMNARPRPRRRRRPGRCGCARGDRRRSPRGGSAPAPRRAWWPSWNTLRATWRSRSSCVARYTTACPPRPISASTPWRPKSSPGTSLMVDQVRPRPRASSRAAEGVSAR